MIRHRTARRVDAIASERASASSAQTAPSSRAMDRDCERGRDEFTGTVRQHLSEHSSLLTRDGEDGGRTSGSRTRAIVVSALAIGAAAMLRTAARRGDALENSRVWPRAKYEVSCDGLGEVFSMHGRDTTNLNETERVKLSHDALTYVNGFWRLPSSHHPSHEYLPRLRATPCQLGAFGMNVVFVRDDQHMCDWTMALYAEGTKVRGKYQYGTGTAECVVEEYLPIRPTRCARHERIWYNKVPVVAEIVKRIESGNLSSSLRSKHYFWLDGDILGVTTRNQFGEHFLTVSNLLNEQDQDKFMVPCYVKHGPHGGIVSPIDRTCRWMRHEVIANIFGGSARAVAEFDRKYRQYIDEHVPTASNGGKPTSQRHCSCPSEELILTTMANDKAYADLFTQSTCAHHLRSPYPKTTDEYSWVRDPSAFHH